MSPRSRRGPRPERADRAPRTPRLPALVVLAGLLVAGGVADARIERGSPRGAPAVSAQVPIAAPASARSSAWYCPGVPVTGLGEGSVVVANAGDRRLTGTLTVFPDKGEARTRPIAVGPQGRVSVRLADVVTSVYASAVIELDGGEAVADTAVVGPLGDSVSTCASSASESWYFAEGATTRDAAEVLLAMNPFPDDAVVDVVFSTEEGVVTPQALTGLLVRGQALTTINVADFVQRRESVSVSLVARTGRLVVGRFQVFDGSIGRKGISVSLGAAALGPLWYLPEGLVADGQSERFLIYNPGREEAQVELDLALETGDAEPLRLTVPRESRLTVVAADESRIPKGVPHAVTVRRLEGPEVVVERAIDGAAPSARTGLAITLGARLPAKRWVTAAGSSDDTTDQWIVVLNPGTRPATVSLNLLADGSPVLVGNLSGIEVKAGARKAFHINDSLKRAATPILITSTEAVVVERDLYRVKSAGLSMSAGVPLR